MSKEIILVRHGKAEDRAAGRSDASRQLTEEGKDEFSAFISSIKNNLETDKSVSIWTSPMVRARQTAEILSNQMKWPNIEEKDFLVTGDFTALMEEVNALDSNTRVVCVGHKPIQGSWVRVLTKSTYAFEKGGVALIRLNEKDSSQGTLIFEGNPTC